MGAKKSNMQSLIQIRKQIKAGLVETGKQGSKFFDKKGDVLRDTN